MCDCNKSLDLPSLIGPVGPQGPIGPQGIQGIQGVVGPQGVSGINGINGNICALIVDITTNNHLTNINNPYVVSVIGGSGNYNYEWTLQGQYAYVGINGSYTTNLFNIVNPTSNSTLLTIVNLGNNSLHKYYKTLLKCKITDTISGCISYAYYYVEYDLYPS